MTEATISNLLEAAKVTEQDLSAKVLTTDYKSSNSESTTSSTASSTSTEEMNTGTELGFNSPDQQTVVLAQLAKQLEYYFSNENLSKDTYLQTLRNLNDGYVPVTILANFTKVKLLVPVSDDESRMHAILQAAGEYSELLRVVSIDASTGKLATDSTPSSAKTILAVGPITQEPLEIDTSPKVDQTFSETVINTIILRDVLPEVTEDDVRALFEETEDCPPVTEVHLDVAHHWFVTLDTDSRQEMLRVVMQLRSSTLAGYPVHARVKATASAPVEDPSTVWAPLEALKTKKKKSNKKRGKKKKRKNKTDTATVTATSKKENPKPNPPSLGEDEFPTLMDKKVEFETPLEDNPNQRDKMDREDEEDDDDEGPTSIKSLSDVASTATTTSSSSSSFAKKALGGYAAALRRAPGAETRPATSVKAENIPRTTSAPKLSEKRGNEQSFDGPAPVTMTHSASWGGSHLFVDVIRCQKDRSTKS